MSDKLEVLRYFVRIKHSFEGPRGSPVKYAEGMDMFRVPEGPLISAMLPVLLNQKRRFLYSMFVDFH